MKEEKDKFRYTAFKKLLLFGAKLTGKTTLAKTFDEIESSKKKEIQDEEGKIIYYIKY